MNFSEIPCTIANKISTVRKVFVVPSLRQRGVLQHLNTLIPQSTESKNVQIDIEWFHNTIFFGTHLHWHYSHSLRTQVVDLLPEIDQVMLVAFFLTNSLSLIQMIISINDAHFPTNCNFFLQKVWEMTNFVRNEWLKTLNC